MMEVKDEGETLQIYTEVQKKVENLIEKYGKIKLNYEIVLKKNKEWCIKTTYGKDVVEYYSTTSFFWCLLNADVF